jgi:DNA-binding LacI/PurR family transcriptional regulator
LWTPDPGTEAAQTPAKKRSYAEPHWIYLGLARHLRRARPADRLPRGAARGGPVFQRGAHCHGRFRVSDSQHVTIALLALPERLTAIFAARNQMFTGVMKVIRMLGLACPAGVSGVGFDDLPWAGVLGAAANGQLAREIGQLASRHIRVRLDGFTEMPPQRLVPRIRLSMRNSCRPVSAADAPGEAPDQNR